MKNHTLILNRSKTCSKAIKLTCQLMAVHDILCLGGKVNTSDILGMTRKIVIYTALLLAQDIQDLSSSKYLLSCKQRGQRFAVNSLPGRKTFSSKETIYLE